MPCSSLGTGRGCWEQVELTDALSLFQLQTTEHCYIFSPQFSFRTSNSHRSPSMYLSGRLFLPAPFMKNIIKKNIYQVAKNWFFGGSNSYLNRFISKIAVLFVSNIKLPVCNKSVCMMIRQVDFKTLHRNH